MQFFEPRGRCVFNGKRADALRVHMLIAQHIASGHHVLDAEMICRAHFDKFGRHNANMPIGPRPTEQRAGDK